MVNKISIQKFNEGQEYYIVADNEKAGEIGVLDSYDTILAKKTFGSLKVGDRVDFNNPHFRDFVTEFASGAIPSKPKVEMSTPVFTKEEIEALKYLAGEKINSDGLRARSSNSRVGWLPRD